MDWTLSEALDYYKGLGAPSNQTALMNLLKEVQKECGGSIPRWAIGEAAQFYGIKETFLLAVMKRVPSLRLENSHRLELCSGQTCRASLDSFVRKTYGDPPRGFELKYVNCMRQCGKGPNIKWDGVLYNGADEALLRSLIDKAN